MVTGWIGALVGLVVSLLLLWLVVPLLPAPAGFIFYIILIILIIVFAVLLLVGLLRAFTGGPGRRW
jgi:hypothetical protein